MSEDIVTLGLGVDSTQVKEAKKSLDQLSDAGARAEKSTDALTSSSDRLSGVVKAMVSAYATLKLTQYAQEAVMLNQRYQQMGIVMGVVAANTGQTKAVFESTSQSLQKLGISMLESRNTVIKLATANIDLANAEKLADLARNAAIVGNMNTSQALDTLVHGIQSAQVEVLRTIGINVNFERSYADLAKQLGISSNNLSESQKQQARMNVVLAESINFNGLYEASLANAGKMMKSTERLSENLKIKVGAIFDASAMLAVSAYSNQLLDLNNKADRFAANGAIKDWSRQIAIELAFVMDMGKNVFGIFGALGGLIAEQGKNIANLDFGKMTATFANADKELQAVLGDTSKYQDMVKSRIIQEDLLTDKITGQNNNVRENSRLAGENTNILNTNTDAVKKAAKVKDELTLAELRMQESTKNTIDLDREVKRLTASVATDQEKYNTTLEELNRLKPYVTVETYNRALEKAQKELKGTEVQTRQTTDEVSQLWMQAGRNIQSALANSIFNFFDDGLKGMLKNVISTVGRIASEFAALRIAQSIGLSSMFSMGTGAAAAGSSGGASLLSNVGSGAGIMSMLKGGMSGLSSGISGMMGGGGAGAFALPLLGGFALNSMSNAFAGDKTLGNGFTDFMQKIPILGAGWDILAGFFGREPYKFRQQSIQGTASSSGFDGDIANVYRSQGGVFSGNKHRTQIEEFSKEQQAIFDSSIGGFYTSARGFVDNLGLSADLVDTFTKTVQIKSEKGKTVTEEAIAEMIAGIGDSLAKNVLPNVEDFQKVGETTIQTLSRLSGEFSVLTGAAALLFDKSSGWAKDFVKQFGFEDRSAFLEKAGGAQAFAANVAGFSQNYLTEAQRMKPVIEALVTERDKLGLNGINTRQQVADAVQSGNLNPDQLLFLTGYQQEISDVFTYLEKFNSAIKETGAEANNAAISLSARNADETDQGREINKRIADVTESIRKMESIASQLRQTVNSINPMSINQARSQILNGGLDASNLGDSLSALSGMGTTGFSNVLDFKRAKGANTAAINALQNMADSDIMSATRKLNALNSEKENFQQALLASVTAMTLALNKSNRREDKWDNEGMPPVRAA